jgi:hypothetical protein
MINERISTGGIVVTTSRDVPFGRSTAVRLCNLRFRNVANLEDLDERGPGRRSFRSTGVIPLTPLLPEETSSLAW